MEDQITIIEHYFKMGDKTFRIRYYPDGSNDIEEVPVVIWKPARASWESGYQAPIIPVSQEIYDMLKRDGLID